MYKISLIIPCYNVTEIASEDENSFDLMINSVINQSFGIENIEVLLIDDCSTDSTKSKLYYLNGKFSSIKPIFLDENSGHPSIPRNVGIDNASADYVMFLDQDDKLDLKCVETLYNEITENDVDFVKANYSILMNDKILNYDTKRNERFTITPKSSDMIFLVSHFIWSSIYSKSFLNKNNIRFPDTQGEDILFLSKCYNLTNKDIIALNDYYGVIYTANNSNSLGHSFTLKQINDYCDIFEIVIDSYVEFKQNKKFIEDIFNFYVMVLLGCLLRSTVPLSKRKKMICKIREFVLKYDYSLNLALHWKVTYVLVKFKLFYLIHIFSRIIERIFDNRIFVKLFRNQNYSN